MTRTSRPILRLGLCLAILAVPGPLPGKAPAMAQEPLVIGVGAPLSGQFELIGEQIKTGVEAAVADINKRGGVAGRTLDVAIADDGCDAEKAVAAANQLVGAGAVFVVGHVCYSATREAGAIYAENGIIQMTPASQTAGLTETPPGAGLFRLAPRAEAQGRVAANFMMARFGGNTIAILHDGSAYGKSLADTVQATLNAAGIQEVWFDAFASGADDYRGVAARLRDNAIDAVFIGGYHEDIARIAVAARRTAPNAAIVGPDSLANSEFRAIAGDDADGVYLTRPLRLDSKARGRALLRRLDRPATAATRYLLLGYAAVERWAKAAEAAEDVTLEGVASALRRGAAPTVIGRVGFDESGDWRTDGYAVFEWGPDGPLPVAMATDTN